MPGVRRFSSSWLRVKGVLRGLELGKLDYYDIYCTEKSNQMQQPSLI
jgi:hypothetical protein